MFLCSWTHSAPWPFCIFVPRPLYLFDLEVRCKSKTKQSKEVRFSDEHFEESAPPSSSSSRQNYITDISCSRDIASPSPSITSLFDANNSWSQFLTNQKERKGRKFDANVEEFDRGICCQGYPKVALHSLMGKIFTIFCIILNKKLPNAKRALY